VSAAAFAIVLASAFGHATWNFLAKKMGGGVGAVWLYTALSSIIYAPPALIVFVADPPSLGITEFTFIAGTALLHACYFVSLQKGYETSDLSLVYPLARGTGPLLSSLGAILLFDEEPTALAVAGILLVALGALGLARTARRSPATITSGLTFGLLTGLLIAVYTLWDKHAVATLAIPPLLYDWTNNVGRTVLLAPFGFRHRDEVARAWRESRALVVGVAVLSPLAYILVLVALTTAPVSYVAPTREVSIVIGTILGATVLAEGEPLRRVLAATTIVAGIIALALG
jgi:drug/metabolite transporter (DMT)-like permease